MSKQEEDDLKEFEEWHKSAFLIDRNLAIKQAFLAGRRTLREKIKADPSIGKLEVDEWPESPNY